MEKQNYAYKFRIYPNKKQAVLMQKHFGATRFVYNYFLDKMIKHYELNKDDIKAKKVKALSIFDCSKQLTLLKKQEGYKWLNEVGSIALVQSLRDLDTAYKNFFAGLRKGNVGYPKFKNRFAGNSFYNYQNIKIEDNKIIMPYFNKKTVGGVYVVIHREIEGIVKSFTVSQEPDGKYYVSILVEQEYGKYHLPVNNCEVGIDLGIKDSVIASDGSRYSNNRYTYKYEKKLAFLNRQLSKKAKNSRDSEGNFIKAKNRDKARQKVAKMHAKIRHSRENHTHNITADLVNKNQYIFIEDLNVKGMVKNKKLAKSLSDVNLGELKRQLEYKANLKGRQVIKIGRFYPSSKTCSNCGTVNDSLKLSQRDWVCGCGAVLDRDLNASINIKREGKRILEESKKRLQ